MVWFGVEDEERVFEDFVLESINLYNSEYFFGFGRILNAQRLVMDYKFFDIVGWLLR